MTPRPLELQQHDQQAWIWLTRPAQHNAFDAALIRALTDTLLQLQTDPTLRVIVLAAQGRSFCAGADLNWMQHTSTLAAADNLADAQQLARLFRTLAQSSKPVIARVQGAALGGGMGLVAACDLAVATPAARFALSEVRLGLIPAVIGPYVAEAIGVRQMRRYALTGENLDAERALRLGLVHELVEEDQLDATIAHLAQQLSLGGPNALTEAKSLLRRLGNGSAGDDDTLDDCARRIARVRGGSEAREGLAAFLQKRRPAWQGEQP